MQQYTTPVAWLASPEWLTLDEATWLSGLDEETLQRLIASGDLEVQENAGAVLIEKLSLSEWLDALLDLEYIRLAESEV
jgi:hypothetical protein